MIILPTNQRLFGGRRGGSVVGASDLGPEGREKVVVFLGKTLN